MTAIIRSALNRIILLLIVAGMILGLLYSAVCDESYDAVRRFSDYQNEISAPVLHDVPDLIAESSANANQIRFLSERSKAGRDLFSSLDYTGRTVFKNCGILSANIYIFLLSVLFSASFKHIFYIHLKDGNK